MSIKKTFEKIKETSLDLTTKVLSIIAYWTGVSISFLLWKLSTLIKKEVKESYWLKLDEKENYESQY